MKMIKIAARAGLPRTTVDAIIRRLVEQGLVVQGKVGNHFEYSVDLEHVADTLDWIEQRLRRKESVSADVGPKDVHSDEKIVNSFEYCSSEKENEIETAFRERSGDRTRILLARTPEGLEDALERLSEYVGYAAATNTKLEILTCAHVADAVRESGVITAIWSDPNLIRLNVVPSAYCQAESDTVAVPDRVLVRGIHTREVRTIHDEKIVEAVKHLIDIACETGWSVNLSTWLKSS